VSIDRWSLNSNSLIFTAKAVRGKSIHFEHELQKKGALIPKIRATPRTKNPLRRKNAAASSIRRTPSRRAIPDEPSCLGNKEKNWFYTKFFGWCKPDFFKNFLANFFNRGILNCPKSTNIPNHYKLRMLQ